jgi:DnaJ-class molecular chaperone
VKIPPGVADGTRLRLKWPASGRPAGYARVRILPDKWFSRHGHDLVLRLPLNVAEAALGCTITARVADGPVQFQVPAGTQPGDRINVAGRGLPGAQRGDLIAVVEIVLPRDPGPDETAALKALAAASPDPRHGWPAAT